MYYNGLFQWYDLVISDLKKNLKGIYNTDTLNGTIINNIYKQYLANIKYYGIPKIESRLGMAVKWSANTYLLAAKIAANTRLSKILILNYFLSINDLSSSGLIEYKYLDPTVAKEGETAKQVLYPNIITTLAKQGSSNLTKLTVIAVSAGIVYLVFKFKKR